MRNIENIRREFDHLVKMHNRALAVQKYQDFQLSEPGKAMLQTYIVKVAGAIQALDWVVNPERDVPEDWKALNKVL